MPRQLSTNERLALKKWLANYEITSNKLNREFSDAVGVAHLLKKIHPKGIDLHNYPSRNNTQLKINNWETLHFKILGKLGIQLSKSTYEKLARGTDGAMDWLLFEIMILDRTNQVKDPNSADEQELMWAENDDVLMITVNRKMGDAIVKVPQKMIVYSLYEDRVRECKLKDALLQAASQKIAHFENMLEIKGERIDELTTQLAKLSMRQLSNMSATPPESNRCYSIKCNGNDNGLGTHTTPVNSTVFVDFSHKSTAGSDATRDR